MVELTDTQLQAAARKHFAYRRTCEVVSSWYEFNWILEHSIDLDQAERVSSGRINSDRHHISEQSN